MPSLLKVNFFLKELCRNLFLFIYSWLMITSMLLLSGCSSVMPENKTTDINSRIVKQWHAPLPHNGQLIEMNKWWDQFEDPLLLQLIGTAQLASPTLAQATMNIADARATVVSRKATLLPSLDATTSASRDHSDLSIPPIKVSAVGLQASWELDIFGVNRAAADASLAKLASSQAHWHDARISVAAEVATTYTAFRACEAQAQQYQLDAESRLNTSQLTSLAVKAGFRPQAAADLARASAAQGKMLLTQQQAQCDLLIKALTALTAQDESTLRRELAASSAVLPQAATLTVLAVPADVITQRPDIYAAARDVLAASAESSQAQAQRWPRITLSGNISASQIETGGISTDGTSWSIGPVAITLPLFDGGSRRANIDAAQTRYDTATTLYAARLREAIQEVETALVTLQSTATSSIAAHAAVEGFELSFQATESSYRAGIASLFELEDARRNMISAKITTIELQRERVATWIALYRAVGGGWSSTASIPPAHSSAIAPY
ncbi:TPA: efflux transporter outer membrane subunit [Aeromonas salmonicida]|nr:efflux transporter outer membrane subunit [Aeromonas salmonicida]